MIKNIKTLLLVSLTFVACTKNDDTTTVTNSSDGLPLTAGIADFSKYVALGDSFAAGYSDGALFKTGQTNSYTNIMAQQFSLVGGGEFKIPYMNDDIGGLLLNGSVITGSRLSILGTNPDGTPIIGNIPGTPTTVVTNHLSGSFNNMGIPGAKCIDLENASFALTNPYFGRIATTATVLGDALAQTPTFFSLWIGGNDELGYATAGGDGSLNPLTPSATFDSAYNSILSQLTAGGKKGVIANLPYVTDLPYFHVIQYNQLTQANLTVGGQNQVNYLNANLYGPLHNALTYLGQGNRINLLSTTGNNPMVMVDENLADLSTSLTAVLVGGGLDVPTATVLGQVFGRARQTQSTDLICLSAGTRIGQVPSVPLDGISSPTPLLSQLGVTFPLPDRYVLIPSEVAEIATATDAYNATIENARTTYDLALFDAKTIMGKLSTTGVSSNGFNLTSAYITGNAFSLDGVHPSPKGYALIANEFIKAINFKYHSNLKGVDLGQYRTLYPASL